MEQDVSARINAIKGNAEKGALTYPDDVRFLLGVIADLEEQKAQLAKNAASLYADYLRLKEGK